MDEKKAKAILEKYLAGQATPDEKQLVEQWYARLVESGNWQWQEGEKEQLRQQMEQQLLQQINAAAAPVKRMNRTWRWAAAVLVMILAGGAFLFFSHKEKKDLASATQESWKTNILPARQQVILTLPDGTRKILDTLANGAMALQGMQVIKKDGSIIYTGNQPDQLVYNTITTEKGRTFQLQLADGTRVWLDAMSSIRFPAAFSGKDRVVEVKGQAYFEVAAAKDADGHKMPFKVLSDHQQVEVLGTHFNVNAYDRQAIQTTLLEGKVRVVMKTMASPEGALVLNPGEQSSIAVSGGLKLNTEVDLEEVMAWKNGRFMFNGNTVQQIMQQLARWYNIEVVYKDEISETFVAEMDRDLPLSRSLELLEMTKQVKFVVEGKKVIVTK